MTLAVTDIAPADAAAEREGASGSLLACLAIVARTRGIPLSLSQLVHDHQLSSTDVPVPELLRIGRASGLRVSQARLRWRDLLRLGTALPAIVLLRNGQSMVLLRAEAARPGGVPLVVLRDPNGDEDAPLILDEARFTTAWAGEVILVKRDYRLRDEDRPFGLGWVAGQLLQDRRLARDLAICAVLLGVLALGPIMFWRLLIDRVMYYGSLSTFSMLCIAFGILVVFETIFGYLRRYMVLFVTTRVDVKLWSYVFNKALNLSIDYFERVPTGEVVRNFHEVSKIRAFLSQQIFGILLDSTLLLIFVPIMFFYSPLLTACVLGVCMLICVWMVLMLPAIRRKVKLVTQAEVIRGSFLVETIIGIRTVKSLALDARHRHEFDVHTARAAETRFSQGLTENLVQTVVHPLQVLMTNGVIAIAVYLAIAEKEPMYIGAIIAFMMLTGRVAGPLIEASKSVVQIDEARMAVAYVAGMVNREPEPGRSGNGVRTPLVGQVEFSEVTFRYAGANTPALDRVSFNIPAGTVFGIVGRSGSGKTTVTRLLQMLHSNFQGLIKIDGNDLRVLDVDHLRSSIGVVLQENFLFRGSIRQTIAATKPDASFEEVVRAARLAGAEEFIERLPNGYETYIQEGSTNLSGGQRQRLAIARALMGNPRILILDEATSALDADSEAIVNANLLRIAQGRTLMIISHRLSSLVAADSILVLERGGVYDIGRHEELLDRCDIYAGLWQQQHRHLHNIRSVSHEIIPLRPGVA